jgi:hypothetical protein
MITKIKLVELIFTALPLPRPHDISCVSEKNAILFIWGVDKTKFRVNVNLHVEEVKGCLVSKSDKAALIENIFVRSLGLII